MQQRNNPVIALALLTLGFVWACDQLAPTAPTAPPAVDSVNSASSIPPSSARGSTGADMYRYEGNGDPMFVDNPQDAHPSAGSGDSVYLCGAACGDSVYGRFVLSQAIRSHWPGHEVNCFGVYPVDVEVISTLRRDKKNPTSVLGIFGFRGMGIGGEQAFKYTLRLTGDLKAGTFPPGPGEIAEVDWMSGEMEGKVHKGKSSKPGCTGDVSISGSFTLTGCPGVDSCLSG